MKHGTRNGYQRGKCRCTACFDAHTAYWKKYMSEVRSGARGPERLAKLREQTKTQNNRPSVKRMMSEKNRARRDLIYEMKRKPCMDCGGHFPSECMDFDHRPGAVKLFDIGTTMHRNWEAILMETKKCEIVCANCHRIRTANRKREREVI